MWNRSGDLQVFHYSKGTFGPLALELQGGGGGGGGGGEGGVFLFASHDWSHSIQHVTIWLKAHLSPHVYIALHLYIALQYEYKGSLQHPLIGTLNKYKPPGLIQITPGAFVRIHSCVE